MRNLAVTILVVILSYVGLMRLVDYSNEQAKWEKGKEHPIRGEVVHIAPIHIDGQQCYVLYAYGNGYILDTLLVYDKTVLNGAYMDTTWDVLLEKRITGFKIRGTAYQVNRDLHYAFATLKPLVTVEIVDEY